MAKSKLIRISDATFKRLLRLGPTPQEAIERLVHVSLDLDDTLDQAVTLGFLTMRTRNALGHPWGANFKTIREVLDFENAGNNLDLIKDFGTSAQRQVSRLRSYLHYPRPGRRIRRPNTEAFNDNESDG